jgi:HPt (histidine-containing phosphotransfer) domain-containing protein
MQAARNPVNGPPHAASPSASNADALLRECRAEFLGSLDGYLEQLRQHMSSAFDREGGKPALAQVVHKLAGTAKTFGFPDISDAARRAEEALRRELAAGEVIDAVRALDAACRGAIGSDRPA